MGLRALRARDERIDFDIDPPYEAVLQGRRFEWILRFERLSQERRKPMRYIYGSMSAAALNAERRAKSIERPYFEHFEASARLALPPPERFETAEGRRLLDPIPLTILLGRSWGGLLELSNFLDCHAAQLADEPWRSDSFIGGDILKGIMNFRLRASHSLGVVSPPKGCFELQIVFFLAPFFDPLGVSVEGRVDIAECAAFTQHLRAFHKACYAQMFKHKYPGKRPADLDQKMEESLRKATRRSIKNPGPPGHPRLKRMTRKEILERYGDKVYWFHEQVWHDARFDPSTDSYLKWQNSVIDSEKGEDVEIAAPPSYVDDDQLVGKGVLPALKLVPQQPEPSD